MPSVEPPSVLYAHYGFRSGPRRFGTRPFNFMLDETMQNTEQIVINASKYEDDSTTLRLYPNNGLWSSYIRIYVNNSELRNLINSFRAYSGKREDGVDWSLGGPVDKWAYYLRIQCAPIDGSGHGNLRIRIEYPDHYNGGKSSDIIFNVVPQEINNFGELLALALRNSNDDDVIWECGGFV